MATITRNPLPMLCIVLALIGTISVVAATLEEDEKDCAEELTNLATCIPFVSGSAKEPTKECCDQTTKLKAAKPKCLCVLIKESTDPSMGLPINTTLALQMPAACKIDAKISECPSLLKIPADSPDAKIFNVAGADSTSTTTSSSTANPPSASKSPSSSSSSSSTVSTTDNTKTTNPSSNNVAKISGAVLLVIGLASISLILI